MTATAVTHRLDAQTQTASQVWGSYRLKMKPEDSATLAVSQLGAPCGRHQFQQPRKFLAHERLDMPHERWVNCVGHVHAVPLRSLSAGVGQRQALNPSEVA